MKRYHAEMGVDPRTDQVFIKITGPHAAYFEGYSVRITLPYGESMSGYLGECLASIIDEQQNREIAYYAFEEGHPAV